MPTILYLHDIDPAGYPPLERSAHILAKQGWNVNFLGTQAPSAAQGLSMTPHPTNATQEWEQFFGSRGVSVSCDPTDCRTIAAAIQKLMANKVRYASMVELGYRTICEEWNYEVQFAKVLSALNLATIPNAA